MKITPRIAKRGIHDQDTGFDDLKRSMRSSLKLWDYFVNWDKVFRNTGAAEIDLNIWNYLIGKADFDGEFLKLLELHPQIVRALPALIVRDGNASETFSIVKNISDLNNGDWFFDFSSPALSDGARRQALQFVKQSGLIRLFKDEGVKNLVDYLLGVEAGLDSNGRKNRSGTTMETIVGAYLARISAENGLRLLEQATPQKIASEWGFSVPIDKSSRRFDFAVTDGSKLVLVEVNFYGSGGSKLKATAGEYKELYDYLAESPVTFVWITDGLGWQTTLLPLQSAFERMDYIWNLDWLKDDVLLDLF
jgi:type II restriction enzyme